MLKLHNTLTRSLEAFNPIDTDRVRMFVCGPTVYDYSHLGHGKTYTQFDAIVRALRYLGYPVEYLVNITDIDDKIIARAKERGLNPEALAREYEEYYQADMTSLNNVSVSQYARARDYIPQIVDQVERLVAKGFAYRISDGYYFDIEKFTDYGQLSGRTDLKPGDAVSRIDENAEKRHPGDFALWKFKKKGEPYWETSLGEGRPGWHIEDTAITESVFGPQYDIHGGAMDLIFPHHEAEIAQMEAVSGLKPLVRYWLHTGFLNLNAEKMSKSLGNFLTIRDTLAQGVSPLALRYYFLGVHYRSPMSFSPEGLQAAQTAYRKLKEAFAALPSSAVDKWQSLTSAYAEEFRAALENDINTPEALGVVWKLIKDDSVPPADKRALLLDFDQVLGLDLEHNEFADIDIPAEVQILLDERAAARASKDYAKSDELREFIRQKGFEVKDTDEGQKLSKL